MSAERHVSDNASELHGSLRYVADYYNEFETLFGTFGNGLLLLDVISPLAR